MKLGLVIKTTEAGVKEALAINKDESWAHYIDDVRPAIMGLDNYDGTGKSVYFVKFLGTIGYLLVIIKSRPEGCGRSGDNTAAWIYIPGNCTISNDKMSSVLRDVEKAISAEMGFDTEILNRVFEDEEYKAKDVSFSAIGTIKSRDNTEYGFRYYNDDFSLVELLGDALAQQEYSNYKGVFFIDAKQDISSNFEELEFEPKKIRSFPPVASIDGFKAYVVLPHGNPVLYDKPIEVPVETTVHVIWKKDGYAAIEKSFIAQDNDTCCDSLKIMPEEYFVLVPQSAFKVFDGKNNPIENFEIRINGELMKENEMKVPESDYKQGVLLSVSAEGFSEWKMDKYKLDSKRKIQLREKVYHYEFEIPTHMENQELDAKVIIETTHKLNNSPIEGYSLDEDKIHEGKDGVNRLSYDNGSRYKLKLFAIGFVSCLLVMLLWAGWQAMDNYEFKFGWPPFKEFKQQPQTSWRNSEEGVFDAEFIENTDSLKAVAYLEKNSVWKKDSLDQYDATRGLFEELNEFRSDDVARRIERLGNVQKIEAIIDAFNKNLYDYHIGKEANGGNYNSSKDKSISVDNYIKWISQQHSVVAKKPVETKEPEAGRVPVTVAKTKPKKSQITGKTLKTSGSVSTQTKAPSDGNKKSKRGGV